MRRDPCDRAVALTQVLTGLLPGEPEASGLLALMLFQRKPRAHTRRRRPWPAPAPSGSSSANGWRKSGRRRPKRCRVP
ncbi:MAG: DUF6596 domain-containing protein [Trebonia sp.]